VFKGGVIILQINDVDITDIALDIQYVSPWNDGASTLTFSYPAKLRELFANGSTVTLHYKGSGVFYGWLFTSRQDKELIKCTCYDQLRYLKAKDTLMRPIEPLDAFVNRALAALGDRIRVGNIDKTEAPLGKFFFNNRTYLDMLYQSIEENLTLNGYYYTLRDNFGALELVDTFDLRLPLLVGDESLATNFDYSRSIDDDTYNYIKVARDDKEKGVRDVYVASDSVTMGKWGKLMLYEKVDAKLNDSQLLDRANRLLALKNRETETLSLECMGDVRVKGGSGIEVRIAAANLNMWAVVESVSHTFKRSEHTMKLNLRFGRWY